MPNILRAKCLLIGDDTVGKTAISQMFNSNGGQYPRNYTMTIGTDYNTRTISIPESHYSVEFLLTDVSGKEMFIENISRHFINASMFIVVYDVTNESTFKSCEKWFDKIKGLNPNRKNLGVLIGNKTDMVDHRVVSSKSGMDLADSKGVKYFECSAKQNENIDDIFKYLSSLYVDQYNNTIQNIKNMV